MPYRKIPLVINHYYHLYNRSLSKTPIFIKKKNCYRAISLLSYYRFQNPPYSFSTFCKLSKDSRQKTIIDLEKKNKVLVDIICFCLMPNHYHLLLKQCIDDGITTFMRIFQNSYARYFNIKNERSGYLFQNRFKAVLIEDETQLLHVSRYIHLNPYSSLIVKNKKDILNYQWLSLVQFSQNEKGFCNTSPILHSFKSIQKYHDFVMDRAGYQRDLEKIKHLTHPNTGCWD